jgi:hypothetical protein
MTQLREMTEDEVSIFVQLNMITKEDSEELYNMFIKEHSGAWVLKAIKKRFEAQGVQADHKTMIMILSIGDGVVGKCAKYVDDIVIKVQNLNLDMIDFELFSFKIYPFGIPVLN